MNDFHCFIVLVIVLFAFLPGYFAISKRLESRATKGKVIQTKVQDFQTNEQVGFVVKLICGIAVVVLVFLMIINPRQFTLVSMTGLAIVGVLFIGFEIFVAESKKLSIPEPEPRVWVGNALHGLTESPVWDWETFRSVLICLARMGEGHFIPASRRPDSISLNGLQTTFTELRQFSAQRQGRETSRAVFVDRDRSCLVISGKTHIGTTREVIINMETEPGREWVQIPILTIHVHPSKGSAVGLSDIDYISFLSDPRLVVMMICIQGGIIFALKTSATPMSISPQNAQRMISTIRNDILKFWSNLSLAHAILAFNKAVCTEFGMTLYQTTDPGENVARRIEVTNP